jgi:hypothetical protein
MRAAGSMNSAKACFNLGQVFKTVMTTTQDPPPPGLMQIWPL